MIDYEKSRIELNQYVVELDTDPTTIPLRALQEKVARCKSYLDRVVSMSLAARKNQRQKEREFFEMSNFYKKEFNKKMGEDRIKILKTIGQQTSIIELELTNLLDKRHKAELDRDESIDYFNDVKEVQNNLLNTMRAIRDQYHIIDEQITIGEIQYRKNPIEKKNTMRLNINRTTVGNNIKDSVINQEDKENVD